MAITGIYYYSTAAPSSIELKIFKLSTVSEGLHCRILASNTHIEISKDWEMALMVLMLLRVQ